MVVSSPNERNWRGIFIALLVIVAVLGLIVFSIILVSPPEEGPRIKGIKPSLEDIFIKLPPPARFNGTWISGNYNKKIHIKFIIQKSIVKNLQMFTFSST